jgi:hypothetical protein
MHAAPQERELFPRIMPAVHHSCSIQRDRYREA